MQSSTSNFTYTLSDVVKHSLRGPWSTGRVRRKFEDTLAGVDGENDEPDAETSLGKMHLQFVNMSRDEAEGKM